MRILTSLILFAALPATALAQTAYVTDSLRLGIHRADDTSDRAFRMLDSGQELEIVNRTRNYAEVRLPDGTSGYVKVAYLVDEKPAKLIVNEVQTENAELKEKLAELNAAFSQPAATIESLRQEVGEYESTIDAARAEVSELRARNESLENRQAQYKYSLPVSWVGAALGVVLLAGFIGGLWWTDYTSRRRHGGIRIY